MTKALFHIDSYLKEFEAVVVETHPAESALVLDQTAFFPGGGGQQNDTGELLAAGVALPVTKVKWQDGEIWHFVQAASPGELPQPGARLTGRLDWARRYAMMRTHTAMHILCGVIWRDYGAQVTGGNMEPLSARMDFEFESLRAEFVKEIEERVNREVAACREVRVRILPRAEAFQIPDLIRTKVNLLPESLSEIRTVEIAGLDLQADGGTHVANTREVGKITIAGYESKGKINKRIKVALE
ncbi:MAG TPA: alanyl-tRNA editing protein [Anaerolineaceae bacterium]